MPCSRTRGHASGLCRPAQGSGEARTCSRTKRFRLEDCQRAESSTPIRAIGGVLLCASVLLSGCLSDSFEIKQPLADSHVGITLAPEVLLEVDDTAVKWGSGKVGEALSTVLVKNHTFRLAHYPIYPTHKVPLKIKVIAKGDIASEKGLGFVKAFVTGLLFFIPSGVIQYEDTFSIIGSVSVIRDTQSYGPLTVEASVAANHILFSSPESYARQASALALEDFANRVSLALNRHPEWFSP